MSHLDQIPPLALHHRMLWEAEVEIGPMQALGPGPLGERRIVPILGGRFRGGPDMPGFHGSILPGGADRQLVRRDGVTELDALYEMQAHDGAVLTIRNRVVIDRTLPEPYRMSRIEVSAPDGPWAVLSRRLIVGTLQVPDGGQAVIIRGWEVSAQ